MNENAQDCECLIFNKKYYDNKNFPKECLHKFEGNEEYYFH